ncbi:hypothetical protein MASR2M15_22400 [Anaerolineales bacterium]
MKSRYYGLKYPRAKRIQQYFILGLMLLILLASVLLIGMGLIIGLPLFLLGGFLILLLLLPLFKSTITSPPYELNDQGFYLRPILWPDHFVRWDSVKATHDDNLLPSRGAEVMKRLAQGKKYQEAEGFVLLCPTLPFYYRLNGWMAGEGWQPLIAISNHSHEAYQQLKKDVEQALPAEVQAHRRK